MKPEREPGAYEVVMAGFNAIREIDRSDEQYNKALLAAFSCAAWPSLRAQSQ
jgi:hypothetical protein